MLFPHGLELKGLRAELISQLFVREHYNKPLPEYVAQSKMFLQIKDEAKQLDLQITDHAIFLLMILAVAKCSKTNLKVLCSKKCLEYFKRVCCLKNISVAILLSAFELSKLSNKNWLLKTVFFEKGV